MPKLKLIAGPYRHPRPDPEWYEGGPDWYQVMRVYQHEVYGRMIVPTIVREGADLIDLAHILRWEVMKHHRARIQRAWDERRKRRQAI